MSFFGISVWNTGTGSFCVDNGTFEPHPERSEHKAWSMYKNINQSQISYGMQKDLF